MISAAIKAAKMSRGNWLPKTGQPRHALEQVEEEDHPEIFFPQQARDVGRADVPAPALARIDALGQSHDQAEGDRADQVSERDEDEQRVALHGLVLPENPRLMIK